MRKLFAWGFALVLVLLSGCTRPQEAAEISSPETSVPPTETAVKRREGIQTLLVACLDSMETPKDPECLRNGSRADLIMVMVIDRENGKTTALQLNPDTLISFSASGMTGPKELPLGMVYSYGSGGSDSCLNGSKAVSQLLGGVSIDHYMTFTMDSIPIVNDMLGGVSVNIADDFPEEYPALIKGENVTLSGETAAHFFRFRAEDDIANEAHMERQRQYMAGMYAPFMENAQEEDFLTKLSFRLGDGLSSDLTLSQMVQTLESLEAYPLDETIVTIPGTAANESGEFRFRVDPETLARTVENLFQ